MEDISATFGAIWELLTNLKVLGVPFIYFLLMSVVGVTVAGFLRGRK